MGRETGTKNKLCVNLVYPYKSVHFIRLLSRINTNLFYSSPSCDIRQGLFWEILGVPLVISIGGQPLHVLGISRPIIRRYSTTYVYNNWYCLLCWLNWNQSNQDNRQSSKKNNKYQLLYTYGCTSWWWLRYALNM